MPELTLEAAETRLHGHGGYEWLLGGKQFWSVAEVVSAMQAEGVQVSHDAVTRWLKTCPHTEDFGGRIGLRASRSDLILYFASRMRGDGMIETIEHVG